jgi:hypothetical protein
MINSLATVPTKSTTSAMMRAIQRTLRFLTPPRRPIGTVIGIPAFVFLHIDNLSVFAHKHHTELSAFWLAPPSWLGLFAWHGPLSADRHHKRRHNDDRLFSLLGWTRIIACRRS